MRKVIIGLMLLVLLLGMAGCGSRSVGSTPGDIAAPTKTPYAPPADLGSDVSADYRKELCSYPWLDTYTMQYYQLSEDGTFAHYQDEKLSVLLEDGTWQLLKNGEGQLTLHMAVSDGGSFDLFELELYEQSIFARGLDDYIFIWLLAGPEE